MNKELIISMLKEIREQLPVDILTSENTETLLTDIENESSREEKELEELLSNERYLFDDPELLKLNDEITSVLITIAEKYRSIGSLQADISDYQNEVRHYDMINNIRSSLMLKDEKRISLNNAFIEDNKKQIDKNSQWIKEAEEEIKRLDKDILELSDTRDRLTAEFEEKKESYKNNIVSKLNYQVQNREENVLYLKKKAGFVVTNAAGFITNLIEKYEKEDVSIEEMNYDITNLKNYINTDTLVDGAQKDMLEIYSEQLEVCEEKIHTLETTLANENNYILSEEEADKRISELMEFSKRQRKNLRAQDRRYEANKAKINDLLEEGGSKEDAEKISDRNKGIHDRMTQRRLLLFEINQQIDYLRNTKNKVDVNKMKEDREALLTLKIERERLNDFNKLHKLDLNQKLDGLLVATGTKLNEIPQVGTTEKITIPELEEEKVTIPNIEETVSIPELDESVEKNNEPEKVEIVEVKQPNPKLKDKIKKVIVQAIIWLSTTALLVGVHVGIVKNNQEESEVNQGAIVETTNTVSNETLKELEKLIDSCYKLDSKSYTNDSYNKLMSKVKAVELIMNEDMLQEDAKAYISQIQDLYNSLEKIELEQNNNISNNNQESSSQGSSNQGSSSENKDDTNAKEENNDIYLAPGDVYVDTNGNQITYDGSIYENTSEGLVDSNYGYNLDYEDGYAVITDENTSNKVEDKETENELGLSEAEQNNLDNAIGNFDWSGFFEEEQNKGLRP